MWLLEQNISHPFTVTPVSSYSNLNSEKSTNVRQKAQKKEEMTIPVLI